MIVVNLISVRQLAGAAGVDCRLVQRWVTRDRLPAMRTEKYYAFQPAAVSAWLDHTNIVSEAKKARMRQFIATFNPLEQDHA